MDDARFDRQRRNVMITSTLLIGAWLAKADFQEIKIFGLGTAYPHRLEILWAAIIAYFMWRLLQLTGKKQREDIQAMYQEMFLKVMVRIGKRKVREDYEEELRVEATKRSEQLVSFNVTPENYNYQSYIFTGKYNVGASWKLEVGDRHEASSRSVKYALGDPEFSRGRFWGVIYLVLLRKAFTEYLLPYFLGVTAIAIGLVGF